MCAEAVWMLRVLLFLPAAVERRFGDIWTDKRDIWIQYVEPSVRQECLVYVYNSYIYSS